MLSHAPEKTLPVPCWPREDLDYFRARAASRPQGAAEYIAAAKLAVHAGDMRACDAAFARLTGCIPPRLDGEPALFVELLNTAVIGGRLALASELIGRRFPAHPAKVRLRLADGTAERCGVVAWQIDAARDCVFTLNCALLHTAQPEYFINHWSQALDLWLRFVRSEMCATGHTRINVNDTAGHPGLAYCARHPEELLIPDPYFVNSHGYAALKSVVAAHDVAWADRKPVVFWRGATTGRHDGDWRDLPRARLCALADAQGDGFDVGFSHVVQLSEAERREVVAAGRLRQPCHATDFLQFKYQIDIDGNSNSWPGLFLKLISGSPTLKVASAMGFRQWYYDRLAPWVHYVPVLADLSDLVEKRDWLAAHPQAAAAIGAAGRAFAQSLQYDAELARAGQTIAASFAVYTPG